MKNHLLLTFQDIHEITKIKNLIHCLTASLLSSNFLFLQATNQKNKKIVLEYSKTHASSIS